MKASSAPSKQPLPPAPVTPKEPIRRPIYFRQTKSTAYYKMNPRPVAVKPTMPKAKGYIGQPVSTYNRFAVLELKSSPKKAVKSNEQCPAVTCTKKSTPKVHRKVNKKRSKVSTAQSTVSNPKEVTAAMPLETRKRKLTGGRNGKPILYNNQQLILSVPNVYKLIVDHDDDTYLPPYQPAEHHPYVYSCGVVGDWVDLMLVLPKAMVLGIIQ